ncbi:prolyl oligopeptidase family serine peptidase [Flavonifractor sp. An10]|uniref:alpha/beta hydrolase n=1 Tax=Flavonifractor sp. An10 TaxID=1965537 RepID=UPI000B3900C7|nr:prolyl oligopeptidase family serine peptidase [Flavonifractor sp. An10]OUQ81372.1 hypothetical protein B5E42_11940 [Flavonifractor sp. An10]
MKRRFFSLSTREGCKHYALLFACLILIFSFMASMVQTSFGRVNIERVKFDARGAVQDGDLYTPAYTNSNSSLPCVVLSHGGGCTKDVMNGFAQELSRRGYVVLNVSSYGSGLSGQPMYDEDGSGVENMAVTSQGLWDAVNYVRTLTFVDPTKIIIAGHSQGGYRCGYAAMLDCPYFTLNDMLINFMYNEFGISFTEEEIAQDAFVLADQYLNEDQRKFFDAKSEEYSEYINTRIKGVVSIGNTGIGIVDALAPQKVSVAGHEVTRYLQTNIALLCGNWDHNYMSLADPVFPNSYFQTGDTLPVDTWVQVVNEADGTGVQLGDFDSASILDNNALLDAIEARSTRIVIPVDHATHSAEFFESFCESTAGKLVEYAQQVVDFNNGPLAEDQGIPADNIIWIVREYLNFAAMLSMLGFAVALIGWLLKGSYYAPVALEHPASNYIVYSKAQYGIFMVLIVIICTFCSYLCNNSMKMLSNPLVVLMPSNKFLPLDKTANFVYVYMSWSAILLLVLIAAYVLINKRIHNKNGLEILGIKMSRSAFLRTLLLSVVIFMACYASMAMIRYLFGQDYRLWMCVFTDMQLIHWTQALRYLIFLVPVYFVTNAAVNMVSLKEKKFVMPLIGTVVIGSLGVWINHAIHVIGMYTGSDPTNFYVNLISEGSVTGATIIFVPITIFVSRICYKLTKSIWTGTFLCSFLTAWMWVSAISSTNIYMGSTFLERMLGF